MKYPFLSSKLRNNSWSFTACFHPCFHPNIVASLSFASRIVLVLQMMTEDIFVQIELWVWGRFKWEPVRSFSWTFRFVLSYQKWLHFLFWKNPAESVWVHITIITYKKKKAFWGEKQQVLTICSYVTRSHLGYCFPKAALASSCSSRAKLWS